MVLIPTKPKIKTNSKQLEIWERIEAQKRKERKNKTKQILSVGKKNQAVPDKLKTQVATINLKIYDIQGDLPKNFDPKTVHRTVREKYFRKLADIKSLNLGKSIILEYANSMENVSLLASDLFNQLSAFSKKRNLNSSFRKYVDKINEISEFLKNNTTETYQKAELLIKLSNNIIQLRRALSGSFENRNKLKEFDSIIQQILQNKVPF